MNRAQETRINRQRTINAAITLMETCTPEQLTAYLAETEYAHLSAESATLLRNLQEANAENWVRFLSAWRAAAQLLEAAKLPYWS